MDAPGYQIQPAPMGGLVNEILGDSVKINLRGRLGVFTVKKSLFDHGDQIQPGQDVEFYFSYIWIVRDKLDYDLAELIGDDGIQPCLTGGGIIEVNDTAAKIQIDGDLGTVAVPRRWLFTDVPLKVGQNAEFYLSRMRVRAESGAAAQHA